MTHQQWIDKYYPTPRDCFNKCHVAVSDMVIYFSDLTVQVGRAVENGNIKWHNHCWCKDSQGYIVDPTAKQFGNKRIEYELIAERFLTYDEYKAIEYDLSFGILPDAVIH